MTLLDAVLAHLDKAAGPDRSGWYTASCPWSQRHRNGDRHPSLRLTERGYMCQACGAKGSLHDLARHLGIELPQNSHRPLPANPWEFFHRRGLPRGFVESHGVSWDAAEKAFRFSFGLLPVAKLRPLGGGAKYTWQPPGATAPPFWPLPNPDSIGPELLLTEGETDALTARYAGFPAYAVTKGANTPLQVAAFRALADLGVERVTFLYDLDPCGYDGAVKAAQVAAQAGLTARIASLPSDLALLGGKDVSDLFAAHGHDRQRLREELERILQGAQALTNLTSDYNSFPSEVKLSEANAATLQAQGERAPLPFLPLLGRGGFIVRGWSHLLAGYPKAGKTELLVSICYEWGSLGETILYLTEEPVSIWRVRLSQRPPGWQHVTLAFALGVMPFDILERIKRGQETVVVIDTIRNLLGFSDEKDNSEIARALIPYIDVARQAGKTIVFTHHNRKGGGQHGEGIAGGHAFLGAVDIALELRRDPHSPRRRQLQGWGRIVEVPELVYELNDAGELTALGEPGAVALDAVKKRVLEMVTEEWTTTREVAGALGQPGPSVDQVARALYALAEEGAIERDPPLSEGRKRGTTHKWRARA